MIDRPVALHSNAMSIPRFIIIEVQASASGPAMAYAAAAMSALSRYSGRLLLAGPVDDAEVLEEGSEAHAVVVFKFPSACEAEKFWLSDANQRAFDPVSQDPGFLHAVSVAGIPEEGLPGETLPTTANVTVSDRPGPRAWMLVQGTVSDPGPIGKYMETIVPMIIERGGVYRVWTAPEGPEVLAGDWPAQYLVLSEWPSAAVARDFWYSDTYQNVAIPLRKPASDFSVLLFQSDA